MKVLYDYQIFDSQKIGGISRYIYELINYAQKTKDFNIELPIKYSNNFYLKTLPDFTKTIQKPKDAHIDQFLYGLKFIGKRRLFNFYNKFNVRKIVNTIEENKSISIAKLKTGEFDIFHPTYYDNYFLDYVGDKPLVITIHDLTHQIFPEYGLYETRDKNQRMIDRANRIITVSHNTKKDLVNIFDVDENKIDVIYLANPLDKKYDNVEFKFSERIPSKYFLFVGSREGYKNFMFFIQMFSRLNPVENNLFVVCTGNNFTDAETYLFKKLNIEKQVLCFFSTDTELYFLYNNAIALVFPSLYEGFGLPVLEAFSCNCLVMLSDSSSLAEIGGNAVLKFNPKDPKSLLNCLISALHDTTNCSSLIQKGNSRLKNFSWNVMGEKTLETYKKVLSQ